MFKNKKVIIFDMDGTLIDSINVWNEIDITLIKRLGYKGNLKSSKIQKFRDDMLIKHSKDKNAYIGYCEELKNKYNFVLSSEEIFNERYNIVNEYSKVKIDYKKDVPKFLKLLKEKEFILVIASTTGRKSIDIYRNHNQNIIKKANLDDYFTLIYTREDVKNIKPDPEVYVKILNKLKVDKNDCLIFEDSLVGIETANTIGIEVVAVYDKYSDSNRKKINEKANYNINNFKEAIDILESEI